MTRHTWLTRRSALKTGAIAAGVAGIGARSGAAQDDESPSDDHCYYQVDFVAGDPIETIGAADYDFYGRQNRLIQYLHVDGDEVIERDTWINSLDPEIRRCVTADPIRVGEGTISVTFAVADGCERQLSLAVYLLPDGEFSFDGRQELVAATTETFGPGTHELTVGAVRGPGCPPQPSTGYEQRAKLVSDDAAKGDVFGFSVAVSDSGETALIGASRDTHAGRNSGSAYVFGRANGTWTQRAKLVAVDAAAGDRFGYSVGVSGSGDTAVVAAYGGVYVFGRSDGIWTQRAKLTALDTGFGWSVAVSGSGGTVVVGADGDGDVPDSYTSGSAYVFTRTNGTWTRSTKLTAPNPANHEYFGWASAVSDSGETVLIGASGDENQTGEHTGSAYVFGRTDGTWTQQTKLTTPDAEPLDSFGSSIGVSGSGDTAVIGADRSINVLVGSEIETPGSAYVFRRANGTWTQRAKLTADGGAVGDRFGISVAVSDSGETAVIGAYADDTGAGERAGSAYVFSRADGTWTQRAKLIADDAAAGDSFGDSVAVSGSGETALIGADGDDTDAGERSGSAYVFGR